MSSWISKSRYKPKNILPPSGLYEPIRPIINNELLETEIQNNQEIHNDQEIQNNQEIQNIHNIDFKTDFRLINEKNQYYYFFENNEISINYISTIIDKFKSQYNEFIHLDIFNIDKFNINNTLLIDNYSNLKYIYDNINTFNNRIIIQIHNLDNILDISNLDYLNNLFKYINLIIIVPSQYIVDTLLLHFDIKAKIIISDYIKDIIEDNKIYTSIPNEYYNLFSFDFNKKLSDIYIKNKDNYEKVHSKIEPYAIYFPQFHEIEENNITFYKGYSDMINLIKAKKQNENLDTPLNGLLGFYNLKYDKKIIETQVNLAKTFGIKGFSIYYYWFSTNTVTGNNMLMKDVVDRFFQEEYNNFDVFFIWANECWSKNITFFNKSYKNPSFNQFDNEVNISNIYNPSELYRNIKNLIPYFKHPNYKKINNKPVFMVLHSWELENNFILFETIFDIVCKENGFDGIELIVNIYENEFNNNTTVFSHPIYKTSNPIFTENDSHTFYLDYSKYIEHYINRDKDSNIKYIFTNFNNEIRYLNHKTKMLTKTQNIDIDKYRTFLRKQIYKYIHNKDTNEINPVNKIFIINAWNEWGEQMSLEPSNEKDFIYLYSTQQELIEHIN
jgi:hypothetical protein